MPYLAEGGRGAEDNGRVAGVQKPQDGHRRAEPLAQPVTRLDGDAAVFGQGLQQFFLFAPQVNPQHQSGKLGGGHNRWLAALGAAFFRSTCRRTRLPDICCRTWQVGRVIRAFDRHVA